VQKIQAEIKFCQHITHIGFSYSAKLQISSKIDSFTIVFLRKLLQSNDPVSRNISSFHKRPYRKCCQFCYNTGKSII